MLLLTFDSFYWIMSHIFTGKTNKQKSMNVTILFTLEKSLVSNLINLPLLSKATHKSSPVERKNVNRYAAIPLTNHMP